MAFYPLTAPDLPTGFARGTPAGKRLADDLRRIRAAGPSGNSKNWGIARRISFPGAEKSMPYITCMLLTRPLLCRLKK